MEQLVEGLRQHLKLALDMAIAVDAELEALTEVGHGRFKAIFPESEGFVISDNRLKPYVDEVTSDFYQATENGGKADINPQDLANVANKLEKIFAIQAQLKEILQQANP